MCGTQVCKIKSELRANKRSERVYLVKTNELKGMEKRYMLMVFFKPLKREKNNNGGENVLKNGGCALFLL